MRRKIAMGTLGFMVFLAVAMVSWAQDGPPNGPGPGQGQHEFGGGGPHQWGGGPHHFEEGGPGKFGRHEGGGHDGWERGGRHGFGGAEHLLRMAENPRVRIFLGLTDEQVGRLHKIGVEAEKSSIQTHADLELRHVELRELLRAENPDHDAIMQKLDEVNALRGKMEKQQVETLLSARSVLTPEQVKKVRGFMENRGGMEGGHEMERRGGMGRPPGHGGPGGPGGAPGGPAPKPQTPPAQ
jgi:Spy/CpxP family protein refolding chaperone